MIARSSSIPRRTRTSRKGVFESPVDDGYLVHALEHGVVWLAYSPELIDAQGLEGLRALAEESSSDVILAPRPANDVALYAVSWGRRLETAPSDADLLRTFIETNRIAPLLRPTVDRGCEPVDPCVILRAVV